MSTDGDNNIVSRRNLDDSLVYVNSIGGEVEIEDMEESQDADGSGGAYNGGEDTMGDDDLYGDLESAVFSSAPGVKSLPRQVIEERLSGAVSEISKLKERITELSRENINLQNNFSSLLKTARDDKNKNIFTLRQLRDQLNYVTSLNVRRQSLSKEEVERILKYCGQVENKLQNQISMDLIRQAVESSKSNPNIKRFEKVRWTKQIKFDNMSVYFGREQIPFSRLEPVSFPQRSLVTVQTEPDTKKTEELISQSSVETMSHVSVPVENSIPIAQQPCQPVPVADTNDTQVKRGNEKTVDVVRGAEDSKRRKTEPAERDVPKSRRHTADATVKTSVPPRKETEANSNSKDEYKNRMSNRSERGSTERRDSRRSSRTRANSPSSSKHNAKSNYHRDRRKSPEPGERSRSRSPHPRNSRTRSNRRVPY